MNLENVRGSVISMALIVLLTESARVAANGSAGSNPAILALDSPPSITTQPMDEPVCSETPATLTIAATGTPAPTFQWRRNGIDVPGATSSTFVIPSASPADAGDYDCVVANDFGTISSNTVTVAVVTCGPNTIIWHGHAGGPFGPGVGYWHYPGNWNLNRVPGPGDVVVIPDLAGTDYVHHQTGTTSVSSLACDESLNLSNGTLSVLLPSYSSKQLWLFGTLTGAGSFDISGDFVWDSGAMTGTGVTRIEAINWDCEGGGTLNRSLENYGLATHGGSTSLIINSPGVFRNKAGATLTLSANGSLTGTGSFINEAGAVVQKTTNFSSTTIGCAFTNQGLLKSNQNTTLAVTNLTNFSSGTFTGGSCDVRGTLRIPGAVITNSSSITLRSPGIMITPQLGNALTGVTTNTAAGSLRLVDSASLTINSLLTNAGTVEVDSSGILTANSGYRQLGGETRIRQTGTLASSAFVTVDGGLLVGGGTVIGDLTNNATVSIGSSPGLFTVQGAYTQSSSGALLVELAGTTPVTQFDKLQVTGQANLNGHVSVTLLNGFVPAAGVDFQIVTGGSILNSFSSEDLPVLTPKCRFLDYDPGSVMFRVGHPYCFAPCAGTEAPNFVLKWGTQGSGAGQFSKCDDVTCDANGTIYVTDRLNNRIQVFDRFGNHMGGWGQAGSGNGQFMNPSSVAVDKIGHVFVGDQSNNRIQRFSDSGVFQLAWGSSGTGDGQFNDPKGVATDAFGNVYVADNLNYRIQVFTNDGVFIRKWGSLGTGNGQFNAADDLDIGPGGQVYVADTYNHRIQEFDATGNYVGKFGSLGTGNGQFNLATGVTVDDDGNIYVSDYINRRIEKFSSSYVYLTQWGTPGSGDGQLNGAYSIESDPDGVIYVADTDNHRVQRFACNYSVSGAPEGVSPIPTETIVATPNPFVDHTVIPFTLPVAHDVALTVLDLSGRKVRQVYRGRLDAGSHSFAWDGRDANGDRVATGIYFVLLQGPELFMRTKVIRMK